MQLPLPHPHPPRDANLTYWTLKVFLTVAYGLFSVVVLDSFIQAAVRSVNHYLVTHTQVVALGLASPLQQPTMRLAFTILFARELGLTRALFV